MFGFNLMSRTQPPHEGTVLEFAVSNWISRWFRGRHWGAVTLPFFGVAFILYWMLPEETDASPHIRVHEWVHIEQWNRPGAFYVQYFTALWEARGYTNNALEVEARKADYHAIKNGLPDWAKD